MKSKVKRKDDDMKMSPVFCEMDDGGYKVLINKECSYKEVVNVLKGNKNMLLIGKVDSGKKYIAKRLMKDVPGLKVADEDDEIKESSFEEKPFLGLMHSLAAIGSINKFAKKHGLAEEAVIHGIDYVTTIMHGKFLMVAISDISKIDQEATSRFN